MASCTQVEQWQQAYIDGALGDAQRVILEEHVSDCRGCQGAFRRHQRVNALLFETFADYRLGRDLTQSVLDHLPELDFPLVDVSSVNFRAKHPMPFRQRMLQFAPAAAVVLLVALGLIIRENWPEPAAPFNAVGMITLAEGTGRTMSDGSGSAVAADVEDYVVQGHRIQTGENGRMVVSVSGGTQIKLNTNTTVVVHDERKVTVDQGQAYFEVEQGHGSFRVFTPAGDVAVYGTRFDVHVTPEVTRVVLARGSVRVGHIDFITAFAVLDPGEQVEVVRRVETMTPRAADVATLTAWQADLAPDAEAYAKFVEQLEPRIQTERLGSESRFIARNVQGQIVENVILQWEPRPDFREFCDYDVLVFMDGNEPLFKGTVSGRDMADPTRSSFVLQSPTRQRIETRNLSVKVEPQCGANDLDVPLNVVVTTVK